MKGQLTIQNPKSYTKEDQKIWSSLFEEKTSSLKRGDKTIDQFWEALSLLKIKKGEIPSFENLNKLLKPFASFEVIAVTGELENHIFFQLVKNRKFPVTVTLPSLFDDLFGRVPFLINRFYGDELVSIAVNATANPAMMEEYRIQFNNTILEVTKLNEANATPAKVN
jgi:phenylalanine-4-hydroxylase